MSKFLLYLNFTSEHLHPFKSESLIQEGQILLVIRKGFGIREAEYIQTVAVVLVNSMSHRIHLFRLT
jgi:hypothetical protein